MGDRQLRGHRRGSQRRPGRRWLHQSPGISRRHEPALRREPAGHHAAPDRPQRRKPGLPPLLPHARGQDLPRRVQRRPRHADLRAAQRRRGRRRHDRVCHRRWRGHAAPAALLPRPRRAGALSEGGRRRTKIAAPNPHAHFSGFNAPICRDLGRDSRPVRRSPDRRLLNSNVHCQRRAGRSTLRAGRSSGRGDHGWAAP